MQASVMYFVLVRVGVVCQLTLASTMKRIHVYMYRFEFDELCDRSELEIEICPQINIFIPRLSDSLRVWCTPS